MSIDTPLKYVWYGDDFTGASDTLATFASAGLRTLLCLGVPSEEKLAPLGQLDALGIAGSARTMSPEQMIGELEPVGRYAASAKVPLLHYKCCSTFDSSPRIGSLGSAIRILKRHAPNRFTPIVGGQPNLERYCAFGNLFAAAGQGGDVVRLDRHPTMSRHPSTPMGEADLRVHLRAQGTEKIGLVDWRSLARATTEELEAMIGAMALNGGGDAVLFDVLDEQHLARIGELIWRRAMQVPLLAVGASSVAQAVISHWRSIGWVPERTKQAAVAPADGPVFVLIGSRSPVSARQAAVALGSADSHYHGVNLKLPRDGSVAGFEEQAAICTRLLNQGDSVLAYLEPVTQNGPPPIEVARACGRLLKRVLDRVPNVRRVGIAGGDTSSIAVEALGIWALGYVGTLATGVSLTRAYADDPRLDGLELMLKGGQMGPNNVFERLHSGAQT